MSRGSFWRETPAAPWNCPRCGAAGVEAVVEGVRCRLDAVPVTIPGELHARLNGKQSYELRGRFLIGREPERIRGGKRGPVLVDHKCGFPIPIPYRAYAFAAPVIPQECENGDFPY